MESLSFPGCIQLSTAVYHAWPAGQDQMHCMGERTVKGKGIMTTYLLKVGGRWAAAGPGLCWGQVAVLVAGAQSRGLVASMRADGDCMCWWCSQHGDYELGIKALGSDALMPRFSSTSTLLKEGPNSPPLTNSSGSNGRSPRITTEVVSTPTKHPSSEFDTGARAAGSDVP